MKRLLPLILSAPLLAEPGDTVYQKGFLSKDEAHKSIELQDGYSLDLVLSDPHIHEPVAMACDAAAAAQGHDAEDIKDEGAVAAPISS